jgi:glycosyltransferase involved in cell wall biosynthesis
MKIGFDGKRAMNNLTGLGNYSRYVIEMLAKENKNDNYIVYCYNYNKDSRLVSIEKKYDNLHLCLPKKRNNSSLWRSFFITKQLIKDNLDLYVGLSNELPLNIKNKGIKSIVIIHDLIYLAHKEYYNFFDRLFYNYKYKLSCKNADIIIAMSECTKQDIIKYYHIPQEKIKVIYQGCDDSFKKEATIEEKEKIRKKYNLPSKYILNVGSIERRKNALLIVKALKDLPTDLHLVIIGKRTKYTKQIEDFATNNNLNKRLHILEKVPFNDLPSLYQMAQVFVYPSFYEGFGIPILEAIHSSLPVIAAKGSCLEEVGGENSIYINPNDEKELCKKITEIIGNPTLKNDMITKSKEYIKKFSQEVQLEQYTDIIMSTKKNKEIFY